MFGLVVIVGVLGLLHDSWPKQTQSFWINIHALIGLLLWLVLLARFVPPTLPTGIGALSRLFSSPVHLALYTLMFIIPILGVVTFVYHGRVFKHSQACTRSRPFGTDLSCTTRCWRGCGPREPNQDEINKAAPPHPGAKSEKWTAGTACTSYHHVPVRLAA
jgi:hypothetical protein